MTHEQKTQNYAKTLGEMATQFYDRAKSDLQQFADQRTNLDERLVAGINSLSKQNNEQARLWDNEFKRIKNAYQSTIKNFIELRPLLIKFDLDVAFGAPIIQRSRAMATLPGASSTPAPKSIRSPGIEAEDVDVAMLDDVLDDCLPSGVTLPPG